MATVVRWVGSGRTSNPFTVTITLTDLDTGSTATSSVVSNDAATELDLYMDLKLVVNPNDGLSFNTDALIDCYVNRHVNDVYGGDATAASEYVGSFVIHDGTANAANTMILNQVDAPPEDFKITLVNSSGASFSTTAAENTLVAYFYSVQSV